MTMMLWPLMVLWPLMMLHCEGIGDSRETACQISFLCLALLDITCNTALSLLSPLLCSTKASRFAGNHMHFRSCSSSYQHSMFCCQSMHASSILDTVDSCVQMLPLVSSSSSMHVATAGVKQPKSNHACSIKSQRLGCLLGYLSGCVGIFFQETNGRCQNASEREQWCSRVQCRKSV